ncbi:uncharacterized protein LOC118732799 [Rhagoletis pomonella]|uniref:uncharacterized protein LOC118732799 n=1 Tax=Rhagoletis pomonella TaxID=28610 RepID=UPI0017872105|nr:uncharacterized protein LOC118732799 [Rhagoletis pomonella]
MSNMRKVQRGIRKKPYFLPAETEFLAPATYCNFKRMSIQPTKRSRASGEQLSAMLDFLGENPNVASGKFQKLHGKLENTKKGGAAKSVEQWQNVSISDKVRAFPEMHYCKTSHLLFQKYVC